MHNTMELRELSSEELDVVEGGCVGIVIAVVVVAALIITERGYETWRQEQADKK